MHVLCSVSRCKLLARDLSHPAKFKGENDIVLLISTAVLGFMTGLAAFCLPLVPSLSSGLPSCPYSSGTGGSTL